MQKQKMYHPKIININYITTLKTFALIIRARTQFYIQKYTHNFPLHISFTAIAAYSIAVLCFTLITLNESLIMHSVTPYKALLYVIMAADAASSVICLESLSLTIL